jgi:MFS family permease
MDLVDARLNPPALAPRLLWARGLRAFCDGYVAVLLPAYLQALGWGVAEIGVLGSVTLAGSALATLAIGQFGHRLASRQLLLTASALMVATGLGFAGLHSFWPLMLVAFFGTLNPSSGDVSIFLPLEHARLAQAAGGKDERTRLFARYSLVGALCASVGALASALPAWLADQHGFDRLTALRAMFLLYALIGVVVAALYHRAEEARPASEPPPQPLGPSRSIVWRLAALFSVDAFAGGLLVNTILALWLFERFGLSVADAGQFFFFSGLLATASQLAAPWVARRIGLVNTMVFTHIPANVFLLMAALAPTLPWALAALLARSALSQMDVPTRSAFVMAVVTPPERVAAASFTAVPRSLASAGGPALGGALMASGLLAAPLLVGGLLKIGYDLALWRAFRHHDKE